ncbi:hypothetical protein EJ02DRAFT_457900 [Clathrospora elynae]|uniref:Uncharacterized protein n=1 Tax=Clathrospora elynae TaxID=706981 RepID=A0A6A5SIV0_9PLEO|nr:hypothetical protein EJ02DRAFT_457900 [Clathrospora elynae]
MQVPNQPSAAIASSSFCATSLSHSFVPSDDFWDRITMPMFPAFCFVAVHFRPVLARSLRALSAMRRPKRAAHFAPNVHPCGSNIPPRRTANIINAPYTVSL